MFNLSPNTPHNYFTEIAINCNITLYMYDSEVIQYLTELSDKVGDSL